MLDGLAKAVFVLEVLNIPINGKAEQPIEYWKSALRGKLKIDNLNPVSYTHLTLPTIYSV